jgi:hypothetical protein
MSTDSETWVVDRFEAHLAVLVSDGGDVVEAARSLLPPGSRVGAVLRAARDADGDFEWAEAVVDEEATRERLAEAKAILEQLRKRDPGGDIGL